MEDRFRFRAWQVRYWGEQIPGKPYGIMNYFDMSENLKKKDIDFKKDPIMQCTGLKDKNGKLIYEGDIVNQIYQDGTIHKCEVLFENCSFQLGYIENKNYIHTPLYCYAINYLGHYTEKKLEIIGNIFEHPELLEVLK